MTKKEQRIVNVLKKIENNTWRMSKHYKEEGKEELAKKEMASLLATSQAINLIENSKYLTEIENIFEREAK